MPEARGTENSDYSEPLDGAEASAPLTTAATVAPQLALGKSANGRYFVDGSGAPFFVHGDTAWDLVGSDDATPAAVVQYLDDRQAKGFNSIIIEACVTTNYQPRNYRGDVPFTTRLPSGNSDFASASDAYFDHVEFVVNEAANRGMVVFLWPLYLGYNGANPTEGFYEDMVANGPAKTRAYGAQIGARFHDYANIVWVLGGDQTPSATGLALLGELHQGMISTDRAGRLYSGHWYNPQTNSIDLEQDWISTNFIYARDEDESVPHASLDAYNYSGYLGKMPSFLGESRYEAGRNAPLERIRRQAWAATLHGASGHFYGHEQLYSFQAGWAAYLDAPGAQRMQWLKQFVASHGWWLLQPKPSLVVSGLGNVDTPAYAVAALASDSSWGAVYRPQTGASGVRVNLALFAQPVRASWLDPTNGVRVTIGTYSNSGARTFTRTTLNADGDKDWVLVFDKTP